ncbi:hypothetical protein AVEN_155851-1, partial [Araneus ventricosus]
VLLLLVLALWTEAVPVQEDGDNSLMYRSACGGGCDGGGYDYSDYSEESEDEGDGGGCGCNQESDEPPSGGCGCNQERDEPPKRLWLIKG